MKTIPIDLLRWPIVLVSWPEEVSLEDMDDYFARLVKTCERGRFAMIVDANEVHPMKFTAALRRRKRELALEHISVFKRTMICQAFVMKSQVVRGVMTAMHWFVPADWPQTFVSTQEEAFAWVEPHLKANANRSVA
jgi:hypothetical protein